MKKNFLLFKILKIKRQKLQNFGALGMTPVVALARHNNPVVALARPNFNSLALARPNFNSLALARPNFNSLALARPKFKSFIAKFWCPRHDSNMRSGFRKPPLYPLSYEGKY